MIRYELDELQLRDRIEAADPNWFSKAEKRTKTFINKGRFEEKTSIWAIAKTSFMLLQFNKCVFCERVFTGPDESRIEMDLEHFRPKGAIEEWAPPAGMHPYPSTFGGASNNGYYWLSYRVTNYAAACKICNSEYKRAFFPIAGLRCDDPTQPGRLVDEFAYLVYPIGKSDEDPESLITFTGTVAHPVATSGQRHARAALIIDFFGLNTRDQLHIQRAEMIERFGAALIAVADGTDGPADRTYVASIDNPMLPHASCLRAFKRLWDRDQTGARRLFDACRAMLTKRLVDPTAKGLGVGLGS